MSIALSLRAVLCPLMLYLFLPLLLCAEETSSPRTITVEECLSRAVARRQELKAAPLKTEAAAHRARQAGRPLNPKLEAELEDFAGQDDARGFDGAETTVSLVQEFELGRKRRHRVAAAEAETEVNRAEEALLRMEILHETRRAALDVLVAQEKVRLAQDLLVLARETESVTLAREQAGKTTALETERARMEAAKAALDLQEREAEQREAVHELALCWEETEPTFDGLAGSLEIPQEALPALETLLTKALGHPALRVADSEIRTREAEVRVEESARMPNLEVAAGVRRFEASDGYALVAGVGIELPLFNSNRDAVKAARADAEAARLTALAARIKNEGEIRRLYARLKALRQKESALKANVLPSATRALALISQAHQQGKAGYLDVLESRRDLSEARLGLIEIASEYHDCRMALEARAGLVTGENK